MDFETEASKNGMVATALRSFDEWDAHQQGQALVGVPPVTLTKVGEAPKRQTYGTYARPLDGIRVLDLTRVLAGPVCGRTLAGEPDALPWVDECSVKSAHGADVLLITSPKLPALPLLDADTSRGKRTTQLDLTEASDRDTLGSFVRDADVF